MMRSALLALGVAVVLLLTGCSGGEQDAGAGDESSTTAAETLVDAGLDQLAQGRTEEARTTFDDVLDLEPGNVFAHYNLGVLDQESGDLDGAAEHYDAALEADPEMASALYNRAILLESSDVPRAVELYERALEVRPDLAAAHMRLGFALLHLDRTDEAEEHLSTGVRLDPGMSDVEAPSYD